MKNIHIYQALILVMVLSPCQPSNLYAQDTTYIIRDEETYFENKAINIPQLYLIKGKDTVGLTILNKKITERFLLIPNAPRKETDYDTFTSTLDFFKDFAGYLDIKHSYKIKDKFVEINIEGSFIEFEGKPLFEIYQTYKKETFYLDIDKSELFDAVGYESKIKLKYFFEPKEYIELLSKTWFPKIAQTKKKYPDDAEYKYACEDCSSSSVSLHPFSYEYEIREDSIYFFLNSVAYFRDFCYRSFCSPQLRVVYPITHVNPLVKSRFDLSEYVKLDRLSKIVFYKEHLENDLKESRIISGNIAGKYPFLMSLNVKNKSNITGHYMYMSNRKLLTLKGKSVEDKNIEISEYMNGKLTGKFKLEYKGKLTNKHNIKNFKWHSPDKKKVYRIEVDDFEIY